VAMPRMGQQHNGATQIRSHPVGQGTAVQPPGTDKITAGVLRTR
jgi:hypothetical protein